MSKPPLQISVLEFAGFQRVGCWENRDGRLHCGTQIPDEKGVYAFSVDGLVQYIGLASKSLKKRLNFYRTPGPSQSTNIRLNALILAGVQSGEISIHVATPLDGDWNGLPVSTAEGLEAGLIDRFELPWNQRGTSRKQATAPPNTSAKSPKGSRRRQAFELILKRPNMTEIEIAQHIFGKSAS